MEFINNRATYILFLLLTLFFIDVKGQSLANYTSARNTSVSYASINLTGNAFDSWRNTTSFTQDDNRSDFTDIGFDFWYNGIRYTQFSISTNGFIDFSSSTDDGGPTADDFGYSNAAFSSSNLANSTNPAIAPFYDDLMAQGGTSALGNSIKYALSGSAPNRTLTVEWINMAVFGNTSPSLNFQVKLLEGTGVIVVNYGTMNTGTQVFSYSMGMNAQTISATPTAAQLKALQTVNTNNFSNTVQNNLVAMPATNSQYIFTPPVPTAASGTVTFSGVTQTGMTVNWPNWATNEIGYVLYNSTDNVNFNFVAQTAANATSNAVTGLLPSTTYYWKVYAVTEGCLSSAITGTQATLASGNKVSIASGSWGTAGTWSPSGVPTAADNVTINSNHTVTINTNAVCNNLTVGQTTITGAVLAIGNSNTARFITVNNNITINNGCSFITNTASNATHNITIPGNITNNGTLNFAADVNSLCNASFTKNGNQTINGTGTTTTFNNMTLSMGSSVNNILEIQTPSFSAPSDFLTLNSGTFKLSSTGASNLTVFSVASTIPQKGGIWLNSASSSFSIQATLTMYGNVTVSNGLLNVGNVADEDLLSNGGILTISNGTINIAGKYYSVGINNLSKFNISGGTVNVPNIGSTNTTIAPFQIAGAGSQFNMSGGNLIINREGGTGAQNLGFVNTGTSGGSVTGGTLQIGSSTTPAGQLIQINSTFPVGNLLVNSSNANASLLTNSLSVINNITINSGTLTANNLNFSLGQNWQNNGGIFVPGTGSVHFLGTSAETIFKSGGEIFNNIIFSNAGTKSLLSTITASNVTINSGSTFSSNNFSTTVTGSWANNGGTFAPGTSTVAFTGTAPQTIIKTTGSETFNDIQFTNGGAKSLLSSISGNNLIINSGSNLSAGSFSIDLIGNWINNGGTFTPGTGTVLFTGSSSQSLSKTGGETFNHLIFSNAGTKTFGSIITSNGNFTINSGATVDISASNFQTNIKGNYSNSGVFTARTGLVQFNGTTPQTISGSSITDFYDVTLNNTTGASLLSNQNLNNALTLTNGTFGANGFLTMISNAGNTARIAPIAATADITGNVNVQRYAPGGYTGWALIGTPISSGLTFQDWNDDFAITCPTCPNGSNGGFTSIYSYNEAATGSYSASGAYVPITAITNTIVPNKGYWVYLGTGFTNTSPITLDVTGSVRKFNNSIPLTKTTSGTASDDGWNLIHNPYPSPISWTALRNGNTNVDNAIYTYNADLNGGTGGSASYVNGVSSPAVGAGGVDNTIPMFQGFYVHCTASTTLNAIESNKVGGNPTFLKLANNNTIANAAVPLFRLTMKKGTYRDETVIYLNNNATDNFDVEFDAIKMASQNASAPSIRQVAGTTQLQTNGISLTSSNFSIPILATTGYNGTYTISLEDFSTFPQGACINIYDSQTGITTDLRTSVYTFSLTSSTTTPRFTLNITLNPLSVTSNVSQPLCTDINAGQIIVAGTNAGPWNYTWKDAAGTITKTTLNKSTADTLQGIYGGDYTVDINTVGQCDQNTSTYNINTIVVPDAQFSSVDTIDLALNPTALFTNTSTNAQDYSWDFGDNSGTSLDANPSYNYNSTGTYSVLLIANSSSGCVDSVVKTIVVINNIATGLTQLNNNTNIIIKTIDNKHYQIETVNGDQYSVYVTDNLGRIIADFGKQNTSTTNVNLNDVRAGMYYINLNQNNSLKVFKVIVK